MISGKGWDKIIGAAIPAVTGLIGSAINKPNSGIKRKYTNQGQDLLWGNALGGLANWGSSLPSSYLASQPKEGRRFVDMFGSQFLPPPTSAPSMQSIAEESRRNMLAGGGLGGHGEFGIHDAEILNWQQQVAQAEKAREDANYADAAQRTLEFIRTPNVRFGYGGGNMGSYTGGYDGPLT